MTARPAIPRLPLAIAAIALVLPSAGWQDPTPEKPSGGESAAVISPFDLPDALEGDFDRVLEQIVPDRMLERLLELAGENPLPTRGPSDRSPETAERLRGLSEALRKLTDGEDRRIESPGGTTRRLRRLARRLRRLAEDLEGSAPSEPEVVEPVEWHPWIELPADVARAFFDDDAIAPGGPPTIPDDPPLHEGSISTYPHIVMPSDLVRIEVIHALPGRPITGERLVRPDGTVSLDWYGDLDVLGLTAEEIKVRAIRQLREFLTDEALGLAELNPDTLEFDWVPPARSDLVFVDVAAYNSPVYHISGDVIQPGYLTCKGNDTVLDALEYSGGLLPKVADPSNIRLVRPSRGDRPARVYKIDLHAIVEEGDATANLQVFPGDRIVVGRDRNVEVTVLMDRIGESLAMIGNIIKNYGGVVDQLNEDAEGLPPERREELLGAWAELWTSIAERIRAGEAGPDSMLDELSRLLEQTIPDASDVDPGDPEP